MTVDGVSPSGDDAQPLGHVVGRSSLWMPPFRTLLVGQAVSSLGDWMATVALIALVHDLTESATAVGGVLVIRLLPTVVGGPIAARLAMRWSPRRTMLAMGAVRAPVVLIIPWVDALWWVYVCAFTIDLAGLLFLPARDATIPELVDGEQDLVTANGLILGTSYGMIPIGAAAFALVTTLTDATGFADTELVVFAVVAGAFAVSLLAIARLPETRADQPGDADAGEATGFGAAVRLPLVRTLAPAAGAVAAGLGALFTIGVVWVSEVLEASDTQFGLLVACFGVGAAGGLGILGKVQRRDLHMVRLLLILQGSVVAGMSLTPTIHFALLGAVAFGATASAVLATSMEVVQRQLQNHQRVLAFTAFHVVIRGALALAAIGAGVANDLFDHTTWPGLGTLESPQVVLLSSGLLVVAVAGAIRGVVDSTVTGRSA